MIARHTLAQHGATNSPKTVDEYFNRLCHSQTQKGSSQHIGSSHIQNHSYSFAQGSKGKIPMDNRISVDPLSLH